MDTITLKFTNEQPTLILMPVEPQNAPASFVSVLVGEKGQSGDIGVTDDLDGFTTDPLFYYILAST